MESDVSQLRQVQALNLRTQIEQEVRDAILRGVFKPGERLPESVIASQLGVSRAPVREVLSALERDGLVVNIPRRGNFVIDFSEKDIDEIYSLRLLLEIGALHRAFDHFTEKDFEEMQTLVNRLGEADQQNMDPLDVMHIDLSFHETIFRVADHSRISDIWNRLRMQTQLLIGWTTSTHYSDQPMQLHQQILDAIRARDLPAAEAVLRDHILDGRDRALQQLSKIRV
ncbi:MAG TPA: GntR family transcriptional regulator [Chloroflexi bacterium]|jgi:DNA-binding GntR family transcriptional regulator|nr:GntR family transcriptional regulator [Chloroflexota bacterium]HPO57264.1 GntR family transcriptional regulator [Anaerolineaceae bacterium]